MTTRDPNTRLAAQRLGEKRLASLRAKPRVVARSRQIDRAAVLALAGLGAATALALVLVPSAGEAKFAGWTCYHLKKNPQALAVTPGAQPVLPTHLAPQAPYPHSLEAMPQGHQVGQAYSRAQPPQPTQGYIHSGTTGLGVVINGVWYPEPDVSRYFYYVEIPGEGPIYCEPTAAVQVQGDGGQTYGSHAAPGAKGSVPVVQQDPMGQQAPQDADVMQGVPFGFAGAPGTIFQPLAGNP